MQAKAVLLGLVFYVIMAIQAAGNIEGSGIRTRPCPGCGLARKDHTWGSCDKNCEGPEKKPKHNFAFDMEC